MNDKSETSLLLPGLGAVYAALEPYGYPLLRFVVGLFLMPHGAQKLFGAFGGGGLMGMAAFFENQMGLVPGVFWALLVGCTEFFGGLLIAIGLLTRLAALGATILLVMAALLAHIGNGFFVNQGGYEYAVLWAVAMFYVPVRGGRELSVDSAIGKEL